MEKGKDGVSGKGEGRWQEKEGHRGEDKDGGGGGWSEEKKGEMGSGRGREFEAERLTIAPLPERSYADVNKLTLSDNFAGPIVASASRYLRSSSTSLLPALTTATRRDSACDMFFGSHSRL